MTFVVTKTMSPFPYKHIAVIGATSSGKSTLAKQLADKFGCHFIELDALHWEPNWTEAPLEVFRTRVEEATQSPGWVVAGNYHVVRDLIWPKAEVVIWLDYPVLLIFGRLWKRSWRRWWHQEELWNGNRESIWMHFKLWSDESLFYWLFKTYWRRKREYTALLSLPEHQHLELIRFKHPKETEQWLMNLH
jgi:adenylate kinase family enzyme